MSSQQPVNMLPPDHFLLQPRQDFLLGVQEGHIDTSTLAAHDFDVDTRTGFMPPDPPLNRLPAQWELWETALDAAMQAKLQLAVKPGLTLEEKNSSELWREHVRQVSTGLRMFFYALLTHTPTAPCPPHVRAHTL
jgi:indoleamine 2,3-dioxygenase